MKNTAWWLGVILWSGFCFADGPKYIELESPKTIALKVGEKKDIVLAVKVTPGFHVQSNPPGGPGLRPTKIEMYEVRGFNFAPASYPPGKPYQMSASATPISVYEGRFEIRVPATADSAAKTGNQSLLGKIFYQACNEKNCFLPASIDVSVPVNLIP